MRTARVVEDATRRGDVAVVHAVRARWSRSFAAAVLAEFGRSHAGNLAGGLAMAMFLAMFPLLLGTLGVVGLVVHDTGTLERLRDAVAGAFPADARSQIVSAIEGVRHAAGWLALAGLGGVVWSGSAVFGSMEYALSVIFETPQRTWVRQRVMALAMTLLLIVMVVGVVIANSVTGLLPWLVVTPLIAVLMLFVAVLAFLRFVPRHTGPVPTLWPGALAAAVSVEVISLAFPLYERITGGFNTYGRQFGLFFLLAAWLSLLAQAILFAAVVARTRMRRGAAPLRHGVVAEGSADVTGHGRIHPRTGAGSD